MQETQNSGACVENLPGVNRQQRGGPAEQDGEHIQSDDPQYDRTAKNEFEPDDEVAERHLFFERHDVAPAHKADQTHAQERGDGIERIDRRRVMTQSDQGAARSRPGYR